MKLTLCLLTWNEVDGCRADVPLLPITAFDEVYALDGGSHDGTVEYLSGQGVKVYQQRKPGYNNAYREAISLCTSDGIVFFHPKGSISPIELLKFRGFFEKGYDLVIASRIVTGAVNEEDGQIFKIRKWLVVILGIFSSLLWRKEGNIIYDVLHGFRGVRMTVVNSIDLLDFGVSADLEMVVRSYKKKLKIIEFPVVENARLYGTTHFRIFATGKSLVKYIWFELFWRQ